MPSNSGYRKIANQYREFFDPTSRFDGETASMSEQYLGVPAGLHNSRRPNSMPELSDILVAMIPLRCRDTKLSSFTCVGLVSRVSGRMNIHVVGSSCALIVSRALPKDPNAATDLAKPPGMDQVPLAALMVGALSIFHVRSHLASAFSYSRYSLPQLILLPVSNVT